MVEATKDLVEETNFDCSSAGIALQSMDGAHVCLISLLLRPDGFDEFQCHRPLSLGLRLDSMAKILRCAGNDDSLALRVAAQDVLRFTFESPNGNKISAFDLKLMDLQGEALGIPELEFKAKVRMPSTEFQRVCRDIGDTRPSSHVRIQT